MIKYDEDGFPYEDTISQKQEDFEKYAQAQLSLDDVLLILNLTEEQAQQQFKTDRSDIHTYYKALRAKGKANLVTAQYEKGISSQNTALLIHLGQHWADQTKGNFASAPNITIIDDSHIDLEP